MLVIIEATSEFGIVKRVWLRPGEQIIVGGTERSDWVLAGDQRLADRHFAIGCDGMGCRLRDLATEAGTYLNGNQVGEAPVRDQDVIVAGHSTFRILIDDAPPQPPAVTSDEDAGSDRTVAAAPSKCLHRVGDWGFDCIPDHWEPVDRLGLRWLAPDHQPGLVSVSQGVLGALVDFAQYAQLLVSRLIQPALGLESVAPTPISVRGADAAAECSLRFTGPKGQRIVQRQIFARSGNLLGTAAFMTQEACVDQLSSTFQQIFNGMSLGR